VKELLQHKANADLANNNGTTPLLMASQEGHVDVVKVLLQHKENVDLANNDGTTPLLMASQEGHVDVVKVLLQHKANVDLANSDGATPLVMASQNGHVEVVQAVLAENATVDLLVGWGTALARASALGHLKVAKTLVKEGKADVDLPLDDGMTPALWAAFRGHRKMLKYLLPLSKMSEVEVGECLTPELRAKLKLKHCSGCGGLKLKLKVCARCGSERYW